MLVGACDGPTHAKPLTLDQLEGGDVAKASGRRLMALSMGLHRLDTNQTPPSMMVVGVHGFESQGYEWAYPLRALETQRRHIYFYRWDDHQCPEPIAVALSQAIERERVLNPSLTSLQIIGHSYGGVVAALVAEQYRGSVPLVVDVIASPVAGLPKLAKRCGYQGASAPIDGSPVVIRQWRTRHELDRAFKDFPSDPQVVDLPGEITRLPTTYQGHRLGHNWSISWVVDHLNQQ